MGLEKNMISKKKIIEYFNKEIIPFIIEKDLVNDTLIVIGGSYSYGLYDVKSDIDIYIFMKKGIGEFISQFRQNLFRHIDIDGSKTQIIPMDLNNQINKSTNELLACPNDNISKATVKEVFMFEHYITIFDPLKRIDGVKKAITSLTNEYWSERCQELCCETIDLLESFYSSLNRCDVAATIKFGSVIKALLQIIYLTDSNPYPPDKWINIALLEKHKNALSNSIEALIPQNLDKESLKISVDSLNKYVTDILSIKKLIPSYIIEDMLNP